MICNYLIQNIVVLSWVIIYWFFFLRKSSFLSKYNKKKSVIWNIIDSNSLTWGWGAFLVSLIIIVFSIIDKLPTLSIILSVFGINICNYSDNG